MAKQIRNIYESRLLHLPLILLAASPPFSTLVGVADRLGTLPLARYTCLPRCTKAHVSVVEVVQ